MRRHAHVDFQLFRKSPVASLREREREGGGGGNSNDDRKVPLNSMRNRVPSCPSQNTKGEGNMKTKGPSANRTRHIWKA